MTTGPVVAIVEGQPSPEVFEAMDALTNAWFAKAAKLECSFICPDCCQSFPQGIPMKCDCGHQSCTDWCVEMRARAGTLPPTEGA